MKDEQMSKFQKGFSVLFLDLWFIILGLFLLVRAFLENRKVLASIIAVLK